MFEMVENEYRTLKLELLNGLTDEEYYNYMLDQVLVVIDDYQDEWKINAQTGQWMWHDQRRKEWIERKPPIEKRKEKSFETSIVPPKPPEAIANGDKLCPACHAKLRSEAKFCGYCGRNLLAPVKGVCIKCGAKNKETSKFCMSCGNKLL